MFEIVVIRRFKCTQINFIVPLVEKMEADILFFSFFEKLYGLAVPVQKLLKAHLRQDFS